MDADTPYFKLGTPPVTPEESEAFDSIMVDAQDRVTRLSQRILGASNAQLEAEGDELEDDDREFDWYVREIFEEMTDLLVTKHHDYGPGNISEAPGGAFNGVLVRMHDKMARLKNLTERGGEAKHESIEDSLKDLGNYCVIALMIRRGLWPGV